MMDARVEVNVAGVFMQEGDGLPPRYAVRLRDGRGRTGGIPIGRFEAWAIAFALDGERPERPMTHDLAMTLLQTAGAVLEEVTLAEVRDETFYAVARLRGPLGTRALDLRPSDALAFALRARCPIYASEAVMDDIAAQESGEEKAL